jgi:hypothetical protein
MRALFEAMSVGTLTFSQAVTLAELQMHSDGKRSFSSPILQRILTPFQVDV